MENVSVDIKENPRTESIAGNLRMSKHITIESKTTDSVVVANLKTNARLKISWPVYELIRKFEKPATLRAVVPASEGEMMRPVIASLILHGILVDVSSQVEQTPRILTAVSPCLFRAPYHRPGDIPTDIAVLGVPFDGGNTARGGARTGPHEIRSASLDPEYRINFITGTSEGWVDCETFEEVLKGITISDWGNVRITYGEAPEYIFERVESVCGRMLTEGSLVVGLGGDHSISYPLVKAVQLRQPVHVVWLDAHTDCAEWTPGLCNHHGNVARRILGLPSVQQIIHVGQRGFSSNGSAEGKRERFETVTADQIMSEGSSPLLNLLPENANCYISIDIDVLDPIYAPGTSTPVPGGLTPKQVMRLLRALGRRCAIVGVDLVEVNVSRDFGDLTATIASQLIRVALSSAFGSASSTKKLESIGSRKEA